MARSDAPRVDAGGPTATRSGADLASAAPATVVDAFEARAALAPGALALASGEDTLTYRELDERSNRVARYLRQRGVERGDRVLTWFGRSVEAVIANLAVMKLGAAFVPVDPAYPDERVRFLITDAAPRLVLTERAWPKTFTADHLVCLDDDAVGAEIERQSGAAVATSLSREDVAYVVYTSGSTGRPKGVLIAHAQLAALVAWHHRAFGVTATDRASQLASPGFDAAVWEVWPYLAAGASVHIPDEATRLSPSSLSDWFAAQRISIAFCPTPLVEALLDVPTEIPSLRFLLTGGDRLHKRADGRRSFVLVNNYGPTECTVVSTSGEVSTSPSPSLPDIGRPIDGARVYVVDRRLEPVAAGEPGELCVGGALVGRGYLNRPALTAERFVPDPLAASPGARMYRTGDLTRVLDTGALEFLGRIDEQVKVRGFRVELGEIEAALQELPSVRHAVVALKEPGPILVAYLVLDALEGYAAPALRAALGDELPAYMVPSAFVVLDALPLTPNGKVDRRALPAPDVTALAQEYVAPRDATEEAIASVFRAVLGVERVGVHDDFFAVGGHSLRAMQASARLRREAGLDVSVQTLFDAPTVEALARVARVEKGKRGKRERELVAIGRKKNTFPLSPMQERLWLLDKLEPGSAAYVVSAAARLRGALDVVALEQALSLLVKRHESLRTTFEDRDDRAMQVVHDELAPAWALRDVSDLGEAERERAISGVARANATTPFDLQRGPLIRATLVRAGERDHAIALAMHHIVSDGWSLGVVARELEALYAGLTSGREATLPSMPVQYVDYAIWQRQRLGEQEIQRQVGYWKDHLAGAPAAIDLPADRPRPSVQRHRGAHASARVDAELASSLRALGRRHGVTTFMTLLAAFSALLARLSGQREVVTATPVVNRPRVETEALIGFFMNTLAIRMKLDDDATFTDLLEQSRRATLGAFAHQDAPFERIVQELNPLRDTSRNPIAQVSLNVLNLPDFRLRLPGIEARPVDGAEGGSKFDLTLYVEERDGSRST